MTELIDLGVGTKTPGQLTNELCTVLLKMWHYMDLESDEEASHEDRFQAGQKVLELNKLRNNLVQAIDEVLGYKNYSNTPKTY